MIMLAYEMLYNMSMAASTAPRPTPALATARRSPDEPLLVALAAEPVAVPPVVAAATWTPKAVVVTTLDEPPVVTVEVTTELAVVLAVQPDHEVHGGLVPHGPLVQPDQVDGGQADEPHQLVHGPFVHDPEDPHDPYPFPGPPWPNGPYPPPGLQPGAPEALNGAAVGAPVTVDQYEA